MAKNVFAPDPATTELWGLNLSTAKSYKRALELLDYADLSYLIDGKSFFTHFVETLNDVPEDMEGVLKVLHALIDRDAPYINPFKETLLMDALNEVIPLEDYIRIANLPETDINRGNKFGRTALMQSLIVAGHDKFKYLLEHPDINIRAVDKEGSNAMHYAFFLSPTIEEIELLQKNGLGLNDQNNGGITPLGFLYRQNHASANPFDDYEDSCKAVLYALEHGAMVEVGNQAANMPAFKDAIMGCRPGEGSGARLFDHMVSELKQLGTKISRRIPPEAISEEFKAFAEVLRKAHAFAGALDPNHPKQISLLLVDMLERTEGSWCSVRDSLKDFSLEECRDVEDAIGSFTESVVLPELAQRTKNRAILIDHTKMMEQLQADVARFLIGNRSLATMLRLSRDWHQRLPVLEDARSERRTGTWEKAAPDFIASNGYLITFLDDADKLGQEGKDLHHCVGGYTENCKTGGAHIASIRKPVEKDGAVTYLPVATIEFEATPKEKTPLAIIQRRGDKDVTPPSQSPEMVALNEFMKKIDVLYKGTDKVTINLDYLEQQRAKRIKTQEGGDMKSIIGYDPFAKTAPDEQDKFFRLYLDINSGQGQTNSFIPGGISSYGNKNAQEFLEESGLMKTIDRLDAKPPVKEGALRILG